MNVRLEDCGNFKGVNEIYLEIGVIVKGSGKFEIFRILELLN